MNYASGTPFNVERPEDDIVADEIIEEELPVIIAMYPPVTTTPALAPAEENLPNEPEEENLPNEPEEVVPPGEEEEEEDPVFHTVTFNSNGGNLVDEQIVEENETADKPETPTKEGFKFNGWFLDEEFIYEFDFNTPITDSITLYAEWIEEKEEPFIDPCITVAGKDLRICAPVLGIVGNSQNFSLTITFNGNALRPGQQFNSNNNGVTISDFQIGTYVLTNVIDGIPRTITVIVNGFRPQDIKIIAE